MESSKAIFQGQMVNNCQVTTEDLQEMERVVRTDFSQNLGWKFHLSLFEGSSQWLYTQTETSWNWTNITNFGEYNSKHEFMGK